MTRAQRQRGVRPVAVRIASQRLPILASSMRRLGRACRLGAAVLATWLAACSAVTFEGAKPMQGNGPNGTAVRSGSEVAVGLDPAPAHPPVYPVTFRLGARNDDRGAAAADPYRWLEDGNSAATRRWIESQNALSRPRLAAIEARPWIESRLEQFSRYDRFEAPVKRGGHYFFLHREAGRDQSALWVSSSVQSQGRVLFDPNRTRTDGAPSITGFAPSPNGELVAYAVSQANSDRVLRFRRLSTSADLADELRSTRFWGVSWAHDGSGIYYSRYPAGAAGQGDDAGRPAVYFHVIGESQDADRLVYAVTDHPTQVPVGRVTDDGRYLVISLLDGSDRSGVSLLDLHDREAQVQPLIAGWDALYTFIGSQGEVLYFRTTKDAPNGRVIGVDARRAQPSISVIPEQSAVLQGANYVGGRIIAQYQDEARSFVRLYERDGRPLGEVSLPGVGTVEGFEGEGGDPETFFAYSDYLTSPRVYRYDVTSNTTTLWHGASTPAPTDAYVTEQLSYLSKDGSPVPMLVTHRRDLTRNGDNPTLLSGYEGSNVSITPVFRPAILVWLAMGGVYAEADLRGGGELGAHRHRAGRLVDKQDLLDDFLAAARYLVDERYTRSGRLAIYGGGHGGMLVGAALTQRPELFAVALPAVGVDDVLHYRTASANPAQWSSDHGLSEDARQSAAFQAYSPYRNVKPGSCYPPTLITTADRDGRVAPWRGYELAAALQSAQVCSRPILIRIESGADRSADELSRMQLQTAADQWAFAAQALSMTVPSN